MSTRQQRETTRAELASRILDFADEMAATDGATVQPAMLAGRLRRLVHLGGGDWK